VPASFRPRFRWKGDQVIVDLPDDEQQILAHVLVQLRELVMGETDPVLRRLGFSDTMLALYEGDVSLVARVPDGPRPVSATITLQACNDEVCLAPEDMRFHFW